MAEIPSIQCPSCRKSNEVSEGLKLCVRCGCDLNRLVRIGQLATLHLNRAHSRLVDGDCQQALKESRQSWELRHSKEAARIGFLAAAALGEVGLLSQWLEALAD